MSRCIVQRRTGFCTYFLVTWPEDHLAWDTLRARARRFEPSEARTIADAINTRFPQPVIPAEVIWL